MYKRQVKTFVISGNAFDISESELIGLKRHRIMDNLNAVLSRFEIINTEIYYQIFFSE